MGLSWARIVLQWSATFAESLLSLVHTCQGHMVFAIYRRHAVMNFACSSTLRYLETNHISLLFFASLHFQCWTNTLYTLTSRAIKKQVYGPVHFHDACLLLYRWQCRYVKAVFPALYFIAGVRFSFDCLSCASGAPNQLFFLTMNEVKDDMKWIKENIK